MCNDPNLLNGFLPIILVRGFDPLASSATSTYYGFNDGTVYPQKLGDAYIYEGMLINLLKTSFRRRHLGASETAGAPQASLDVAYKDATNAIRYLPYPANWTPDPRSVQALANILGHPPTPREMEWITGPVLLDPLVAERLKGMLNTIWVYRFYDFKVREVDVYAEELEYLIAIVKAVTGAPMVNLICHSMGGIVARKLIYNLNDPAAPKKHLDGRAETHINKWITLGTPHRGIAFQIQEQMPLWELSVFNQDYLAKMFNTTVADLGKLNGAFDPEHVLCVVGTNHSTYNVGMVAGKISSGLNQLASWVQGQDQNRSDGLVKQDSARLAGTYRADVYKCHGGDDALVTSREAYELATRFMFGDVRVRVRAQSISISPNREGGYNLLSKAANMFGSGQPELFLGFSLKPRDLDFFLHQQDKDSENCFGPFRTHALSANDIIYDPEDATKNGIIYEGFINSALANRSAQGALVDLAFRFDTYVGERDAFLLMHSDTEIVKVQSYVKVEADPNQPLKVTFYPRLTNDGSAISCVYNAAQGVYTLPLPFGTLDPDLAMNLEIAIEKLDNNGQWVSWNVT